MENPIIVPFDLNTARKIKSGEIEGSVLIDNIEIEFVYESKDCAGPYNSLFVRKDGYGISSIYANTEGCTIGGTTLELKVEAGAYFKKGDVLTSTNGYQFIYDGIITKGIMGCICGMATFGDIGFDYKLWTHVYDEDKKRHVRKAYYKEPKYEEKEDDYFPFSSASIVAYEYKLLYHEKFFEHLHMKRLVIDENIPFPVSTWERSYRYKGYGYNMCRETKKKLLQALKGVNVEEEDVSLYTTGGWD